MYRFGHTMIVNEFHSSKKWTTFDIKRPTPSYTHQKKNYAKFFCPFLFTQRGWSWEVEKDYYKVVVCTCFHSWFFFLFLFFLSLSLLSSAAKQQGTRFPPKMRLLVSSPFLNFKPIFMLLKWSRPKRHAITSFRVVWYLNECHCLGEEKNIGPP